MGAAAASLGGPPPHLFHEKDWEVDDEGNWASKRNNAEVKNKGVVISHSPVKDHRLSQASKSESGRSHHSSKPYGSHQSGGS